MSCNIYYENKKVNIEWKHHILKIFDCGNLLALTLQNNLLLIKREDYKNPIKLRDNVLDVSYSYPLFYIVTTDGKVFKTNIEQINDNRWDEIIVDQKITQISGNGDGLLMINDKNEILGMGNFENVLCSDEPKKIDCFSRIKALQVATGDNFALVLVLPQRPQQDDSLSQNSFIEKVKHDGRDLLKTQVWSFGSINKGLLGCGDHVKRKDYTVIIKLVDIGVYKIHCGSHHAAALTLDGRLFLWGFNNHQQISMDASIQDMSFPVEFKVDMNGKSSKNVLAVTTSTSNTVILFNDLSFKILGKSGNSSDDNEEFASDLKYEYDAGNLEDNENINCVPYIVSHNKVLLVNQKNISVFLLSYLNEEQRNVRAMVNIYQRYLTNIRNVDDDSRKLVKLFENLLYISIMNLHTSIDFLQSEYNLEKTIVNVNFVDVIREYQRYLKQFCDIISYYSIQHYEKRIDKKIIKIVLEKPFVCLEMYEKLLDLIYDLHLYNNKFSDSLQGQEIEELKRQTIERKKTIEDFRKIIVAQKIKEAEETFTFWQTLNDSAIKQELHQKERRFVMDSMVVPLKLHERSTFFGKQRFILFNDYLAYSLARTEFIPIHLVWLQAYSTTSSNKFSFKIITPENVLKVYALTAQDKIEWMKNIRECIWQSLRRNPSVQINQALPVSRYGSYKFTDRHSTYANYEVEGKWFEGRFTDMCHVRNPAINRLYKCRITNSNGELNGHGIVEDQSFTYHGEFHHGKLQGFGTWKSKFKAISYQGFFKQDKFDGYGVLSDDEVTYYGEFVNGLKNGYGIEDDVIRGNKYIGMWQDGKRHGSGILITIDGSYFEGNFVNNQLCGEGLAIFSSGRYYIGELTTDGANGNGCFYIPETEIIEEIMELDDCSMKMKGNVLQGALSGTWDKFQISNGSMLMNSIFLRTPSSQNHQKINSERKYSKVFENWNEDVFGTSPEKLTLHDRWYRLSSFIARKKSFENDMKTNFMLINETINDSEFNEMQFTLPSTSEQDNLSIPSISRSNSEIHLKAPHSDSDFETSSLRTLSDYSISSIVAPKKSRISASDFDFVPNFYSSTFTTAESLDELKNYLNASINDILHPFHLLVTELRKAFCGCYGNWRSKPTSILSKIATSDWIFIMKRIYNVFRLLFPYLPACSPSINDSEDFEDENGTNMLSPLNFMHQLLLNDEIYSCFFLLYASKNSRQDELYAQRLITCEKKSNEELRQLLKIEPNLIPLLEHEDFSRAIETFKRISQMYCPSEIFQVIKDTFEIITNCANDLNTGELLSADNLLSTFIYLIVKAAINHLGAELSLFTDLMDSDIDALTHMDQYIYTNVKCGYLHTISSRFFHN